MKHWHIDDIAWDRFDPSKVDPNVVPLVKAAAMVERNGEDYRLYLNSVFADDPDFRAAADRWADRHGWLRSAVLNTANMAWFSADRTIAEYAAEIWNIPRMC